MFSSFTRSLAIYREGVDFHLPEYWDEQILTLSRASGRRVVQEEPSSVTDTNKPPVALRYYVVTGEVIASELTWLMEAYHGRWLELAEEVAGEPVCVSDSLADAVNISRTEDCHDAMDWHRDSNPLTGLLYVTSHPYREGTSGGETRVDIGGIEMSIHPERGVLLMYDASRTSHCSAPPGRGITRVSVPMNYYIQGRSYTRPEGLDDFLGY